MRKSVLGVRTLCLAVASISTVAAFAQTEKSRESYVLRLNKALPHSISATADGTTIVYHYVGDDTENFCNTIFGIQVALDAFRKFGFTQFVCTNDRDKKFALDLRLKASLAANHDTPNIPAQSIPSANETPGIPERTPSGQADGFFVGQRLVVVSEGLAIPICDTFDDNMFAVGMPALTIHIENDVAKYDRHPVGGLFTMCRGIDTEPLHTSEVVQVKSINIHGREYRMRILSVPHSIQRGLGAYQHTVYEPGTAELRFKLKDPKDSRRAVRAWLKPTTDLPGNTATGVQVPNIREGMTQAEVEQVIGPPDLKFEASGSTTYTYGKLGIAVIFTGGKVTQISNTH
jgi:hypothetical protein